MAQLDPCELLQWKPLEQRRRGPARCGIGILALSGSRRGSRCGDASEHRFEDPGGWDGDRGASIAVAPVRKKREYQRGARFIVALLNCLRPAGHSIIAAVDIITYRHQSDPHHASPASIGTNAQNVTLPFKTTSNGISCLAINLRR